MKIYCEKCKKAFASSKKFGDGEDTCPDCGSVCPVPANATAPGAVIGDFLIRKLLSKGGMGEVFLAHQISLDRPAALKVLQQKFVNDREYVGSLIREARSAARLNHPNIVQAYAVGKDDGNYYFAMEYVEGETFKTILQREGVLDFVRAAKVVREIADALKTAWNEQKLVHQDIKPDNIMLAANGRAKLADLGLSHSAGQDENIDSDEVLGTPQYISPEQLTGVPTDVRSDIYSLGATFFQFVTGRFPYVADNADDIARMHVAGNLEPPKSVNPKLPDELNSIILKMMARNIEERYQAPEALIHDLDLFIDNAERKGKIPALRFPKTPAPAAPSPGAKTPSPILKAPSLGGAKTPSPILKAPSGAGGATTPPTLKAPAAAGGATTPPTLKAPAAGAATPRPVLKAVPANGAGTPPPASPVPAEKKEEGEQPPVAAADAEPKSGSGLARGKILLISGIVGGAVLLLAALGAGVFFWHRSGTMPEALARYVAPVIEKVIPSGGSAPATPSKPKPKPKPVIKPRPAPKPIVPPPPKTRPEYLAKLRKAGEMPRRTSAEKQAFLAAVDAIFAASVLGSDTPVTAEERVALVKLLNLYAPVDEELRFVPGRSALAGKIEAENRRRNEALRAARRAEEEKRRAEARRAEEERQRAARQMREAEAERKRLEAMRRQEEAERKRLEAERIAMLRSMFEKAGARLAAAFVKTAFDDDQGVLREAVTEANAVEIPAECTTTTEKNMIANFKKITAGISPAAQTLRNFIKAMTKISEKDGVVIRYGRGVVVLHEIKPGVLRGRSDSGIIDIKLDDARVRQNFFSALTNYLATDPEFGKLLPAKTKGVKNKKQLDRLRMQNIRWCEFHFRVMNRDFSPETAKLAPNDFWRRSIVVLKKNVPVLPSPAK